MPAEIVLYRYMKT